MNDEKQEIILGAGELYMFEFNGTDLPSNEEIETDKNNVGHCSGGFSLDYKPEVYDVKNWYGKIVKRFIIGEEMTIKSGIISWSLDKLSLLSTAKFSVDAAKKIRTLVFGGNGNLKTVLIRFVHTKENGKKLRFTSIAQGGNGFALEFSQKELTIDATLTAIEVKKDWLAEFEEEMTDEEAAKINSVILSSGSLGIAGDSKITGLTANKTYKVTSNSIVKYTNAAGTLVEAAQKAPLGTGKTEITGLTNGTTYMVEEDKA